MDGLPEKVRPWILLKREEAAQRAGFKSVKHMQEAQKGEALLKEEIQQKKDEEEERINTIQQNQLIRAKKQLGGCLLFQSQHGNRVRATIKDRAAGEQVVLMNNENTRRISELKQQIAQLEPPLK